jgi:hypothetical protein
MIRQDNRWHDPSIRRRRTGSYTTTATRTAIRVLLACIPSAMLRVALRTAAKAERLACVVRG